MWGCSNGSRENAVQSQRRPLVAQAFRPANRPPGSPEGLRYVVVVIAACVPLATAAQPRSGTSSAGLYYEESGRGDPVVLIHAFSVDRRMWDPQMAALQSRFTVIRYDLRGHGRSAAPSEPYSTSDDLRSVLDALDVGRAALVGLSAGAQVATDFALTNPDRVTRLVLAAPGLGGMAMPPLPWMQPVFQAAGAGEPERAAELWSETPIMQLRSDTSAAAALLDTVMSNAKLWTYRTNPVQPVTPPAIKRLSEIKSPTLVIVGERDLPHITEAATLLAKGISGAKLVTIPGAGHIVNIDARERFTDEVVRFLSVK
jgi:pimeloyl-ACP methyl ester carboxylesterase